MKKELMTLKKNAKFCFYCGEYLETRNFDRLNYNKGFKFYNTVICCDKCKVQRQKLGLFEIWLSIHNDIIEVKKTIRRYAYWLGLKNDIIFNKQMIFIIEGIVNNK